MLQAAGQKSLCDPIVLRNVSAATSCGCITFVSTVAEAGHVQVPLKNAHQSIATYLRASSSRWQLSRSSTLEGLGQY